MNPAATLNDLLRLPDAVREKHIELLHQLEQLRLTCRVEMSGRDIVVIVAPAMPPAAYWLNRFDCDAKNTP